LAADRNSSRTSLRTRRNMLPTIVSDIADLHAWGRCYDQNFLRFL
jgi:hypothetical protein